jgi:hypothetical protein
MQQTNHLAQLVLLTYTSTPSSTSARLNVVKVDTLMLTPHCAMTAICLAFPAIKEASTIVMFARPDTKKSQLKLLIRVFFACLEILILSATIVPHAP